MQSLKTSFSKFFYLLFFIFLVCNASFAQKDIRKTVLIKNKVGKSFCFDSSSKKNGINKIYIKYLGSIVTSDRKNLKVLSWERVWGVNRHTTGIIYLFDQKSNYIGKYILGDGKDLPYKVQSNNLVFMNTNKSKCDNKLVTRISFEKGIPPSIFLKCKGESGDIYSFSNED